MNKFLRVLGLGLMMMTFAFAGIAQGQERTYEIVYKEFTDNFDSTETARMQKALDAAKEFIAKFNTPDYEAQVTYLRDTAIPYLEKAIGESKDRTLAKGESDKWYALLGKITEANKAKNWAEVMTLGKQALNTQFQHLDKGFLETAKVKEQKLDIAIILGVMGFDRAVEKNDTFNNDGITYLKQAIQQIEAGQTSPTYGLLGYELKNKDNALGLMNYYIGYIMNYRQNKAGEARDYFYKASQYNSDAKGFAAIYENIGAKYYDKIAELDPKRIEKTKSLEGIQDEAARDALIKEIKDIYAEEKGNAERGIEAYSKALKAAQADPKTSQQYKDGLLKTLEQLYQFRFPDKKEGLQAYINTAAAKPLTNPSTPVQPIVEEETETTNTVSTPPSTTPSTKPATSNGTKTTTPTTNGTKTTTVKTAATESKTTPAKKPRKR